MSFDAFRAFDCLLHCNSVKVQSSPPGSGVNIQQMLEEESVHDKRDVNREHGALDSV